MDDIRSWANEIKPEELPEPYRLISTKIGIENTLTLADMYQGLALYLPKLDSTLSTLRDKKIKQEFNGYNYRELAIKYKLTERWIREIIEKNTDTNQISIFEVEAVK